MIPSLRWKRSNSSVEKGAFRSLGIHRTNLPIRVFSRFARWLFLLPSGGYPFYT